MKNKTLTSWLIEANKLKSHISNIHVHENKLKELEELVTSGIPTYKFHFFDLISFLRKTNSIQTVFGKYDNKVVARIVSVKNNYPRYTYIEKEYRYIIEQIQQTINPKYYAAYKVVLNVYDPAKYCGVIISSYNNLVIEMVEDENLEKLCHGQVIPWHAEFSNRKMHNYKTMIYKEPIPVEIKNVLWKVIKSISYIKNTDNSSIPHYIPKYGDYEFVISKKDGLLRFVEFKQSNWKLLR